MTAETIVKIDGSYGEGGGQILRTALTLSALTGRPLEIFNVRVGRKEPGLKPQHLISARSLAEVTNGRLKHDELNSPILRFFPGRIKHGTYSFDVSSIKASAGATGLIFQTLAPVLSFANKPSDIVIIGGTHVPWSPSANYLQEIFIPAITKMGIDINIAIPKFGFYPIGGGEIDIAIKPCARPLTSVHIVERGKNKKLTIISAVANLPLSIAERQRDRALKRISNYELQITNFKMQIQSEIKEVPSSGRGTFLFIMAEFENVRSGFIGLGAIGKRAEKVADEAVEALLQYLNGNGALDPHLADQIVLYAALAQGQSMFTTTRITNHLLSNIWIIEQFLPVKFEVKGIYGDKGTISVKGIGYA